MRTRVAAPLWLIGVLTWLWIGPKEAWAGPAAPLDVQQRVSKEKVHLGERFLQELVITHEPEQRYDWVPPTPAQWGDFELLKHERSRSDEPGKAITRFQFTWALFALGRKALPRLTFEQVEGGAKASWEAPVLEVEAVPTTAADGGAQADAAGLRDIKPLEDVPVPSYRLLWGAAALLGALVLAVWLLRLWRSHRARARLPPPAPVVPLPDRTLAALDALQVEHLPQQGDVQAFYFRLSDIFRGYLGERYGFEALECTTVELLNALSRTRDFASQATWLAELETFVRFSDLVKFARGFATLEECDASMRYVRSLIHRTSSSVGAPNA